MTLKLDRKLNLVIPLDYGNVAFPYTVWVHATPIGREVFEANHLVLARTFSKIFKLGLDAVSGPRVAALMLRETAEEMGVWKGEGGTEISLIGEMVRLANVLAPKADGRGWEPIPFQEAVDKNILDEDDLSEVTNALAFFTVASTMYQRRAQETILQTALSLWGGLLSPLDFTAFSASLRTSTKAGNTGERTVARARAGSSVPF